MPHDIAGVNERRTDDEYNDDGLNIHLFHLSITIFHLPNLMNDKW